MDSSSGEDSARCPVAHDAQRLAPDATLLDPKVLTHPNPFYERLRTEEPVRFDPKLEMYLVSRYEDIHRVLTEADTFSLERGYNAQYVKGYAEEFKDILRRDGGGYFPDTIMTDPPRHTRPRRLLEQAFTAHRVKQLEPRIAARIVDRIEKFADIGRMDAVKDFAAPTAISIMCEQLDLDQADAEKIHRWSSAATRTLGRMNSRDDMLAMAKDLCDLQHYLAERVRERREKRGEDLLSDIIYARIDDDENPTLNHDEVMAMGRVLIAGGNETIATALSNLVYTLATEPAIAQQLRDSADDDRRLTRFVEELMRYEPPVRALSRMTTREVELGGQRLPAGAHLLVLFASGNDDDAAFACPRDFDPSRTNIGRHLSFGAGVHRCVGIALARMEVKVAARELVTRLADIKLAIAKDEIALQPTIARRSMASLPITFTRRT